MEMFAFQWLKWPSQLLLKVRFGRLQKTRQKRIQNDEARCFTTNKTITLNKSH